MKSRDYSTTKYVPKNPLGMKDYTPEEMATREAVMDLIRSVFKRHGAVSIETPVVELKSTLTGKYGEDSKLIYDLKDQGGEILALRYDLTVPFARYCAQHNIEQLKRYHIARVYRRDRPVMAKGRYREFYQCDLDIAGKHESMLPDAECLKIVSEAISAVGISYQIKVNSRKLLDGIFAVCGVAEDKLRPICSAVDKLDKLSWEEVKKEMLEKGLEDETAEKIWKYVQNAGGSSLVEELLNDEVLTQNVQAKEGLDEMKALFKYCEAFGLVVGASGQVLFDLSLARGLDYYTGMIFEAVGVEAVSIKGSQGSSSATKKCGSIAGGGRYDNLVGMFKRNKKQVPCVGLSLGIERLFLLYAEKQKALEKAAESETAAPNGGLASVRKLPTEVLVCVVGAKANERQALLEERLKILNELWSQGINAETQYKMNPKALSQFQFCEENKIPVAIIVAPEEMSNGVVKVRVISTREETTVKRSEVVAYVSNFLQG